MSQPTFPGLGQAMSLIQELGFTVEVINELTSFLTAKADELDGMPAQMPEPDGPAYGANSPGVQLAYHSGRARAHVVDAVVEMARGLGEYREAVQSMTTWAMAADDLTRSDLERQLQRADSIITDVPGANGRGDQAGGN